jgi:hypothetical protein
MPYSLPGNKQTVKPACFVGHDGIDMSDKVEGVEAGPHRHQRAPQRLDRAGLE